MQNTYDTSKNLRLKEEIRLGRVERSRSVEEPNGKEEPTLVEIYQPVYGKVSTCRKCGESIHRLSKTGLCRRCRPGEKAKHDRGEPSLLD